MISSLRERFPDLPELVLWKTELLFRGVRFTDVLAEAVAEGAAPNFWPYRKRDENGQVQVIQVPYLFQMEGGAVARVRVDDRSDLEVRRDGPESRSPSGTARSCSALSVSCALTPGRTTAPRTGPPRPRQAWSNWATCSS